MLNDRCLDVCEKAGCHHRDADCLEMLEDRLTTDVHDIEELAERCQKTKVCGYYAARNVAVQSADLIVTAYQSILSESTRASLGIENLCDKIIVFDEAHNLLETISDINSTQVAHGNFRLAHTFVKEYLAMYQARMSPQNVKLIGDLCMVLKTFIDYMAKIQTDAEVPVGVMELLLETDLYTFDFTKLTKFFEKADLVKKLNGFVQHRAEQELKVTKNEKQEKSEFQK